MKCNYCNKEMVYPCIEDLEEVVKICQNYHNLLLLKLRRAQIASCNCLTKTSIIDAHKSDCLYRILEEAHMKIKFQEQEIEDLYKYYDETIYR